MSASRLRLDIAYDGTEFAGWAVQGGQRTVAGVLDDALTTVFRTPLRCVRPGAPTPVCTPPVRWPMSTFPPTRWATPIPGLRGPATASSAAGRRLARFLPEDVRVRDIVRPPKGFDARFSALRRHYVYRLSTAPYGVDPQRRAS